MTRIQLLSKFSIMLLVTIAAGFLYPQSGKNDFSCQWNLNELYGSPEAWQEEYQKVAAQIPALQRCEASAGSSARELLHCLQLYESVQTRFGRVFLYAELSHLKNQQDAAAGEMYGMCTRLAAELSRAFSYFRPVLLSVPEEEFERFFTKEPELNEYRHYLGDIRRSAAHTGTKQYEALIASVSGLAWNSFTTFSTLTGSDMQFPLIRDDSGNEIRVNRSRNYSAMFSTDREYRKRSYTAFLTQYQQYANTFSSVLKSHIQTQTILAEAKKYHSVLEAKLAPEQIPTAVYDNLINTINSNLGVLKRWGAIKKEILQYDTLYPWDTYVTLFPASKKTYTFAEAREMAMQALAPLGEQYLADFTRALDNNWVDVYEQEGKSSGGMCKARFGADHPYVLLNFYGDLQDVFTFIHEMGHALYRYYSFANQNYFQAYYSSFTSEAAAILNETLLSDYLISRAASPVEQMALIEERIYRFQLDFFQMTRTAEFEKKMYEMYRRGEPLTAESLSALYADLYTTYWGGMVEADPLIRYKWSVWPHMYFNYYIYQYGTSLAAAEHLAAGFENGGEVAVARYLELLRQGSSDYPITLLKRAGVDMSSPRPIQALIDKMSLLLDALEALCEGK